MKHSVTTAAVGLLLSAALALPAVAQNVAIVNGKAIPKTRVDAMMEQVKRQGQPLPPDIEDRVREEVIMREVFAQEAERRGLGTSPSFGLQVEMARQTLLIRELLADFQNRNPVTDQEIQAEYDRFKAEAGGQEYRARHILVEKEEEAKALIAQLQGGGDFAELASKSSKDTGSAARGGDLDWASPSSYVKEFSDAMVKLEKGKITQTPVKSQFGYHVIKLEDVREAELPSLEEVRPQIQQALAQQKLAKFQEELRDKAKVQ